MGYNGAMLISEMMGKDKEISILQDKLKRRNLQIADLKARLKELQQFLIDNKITYQFRMYKKVK